MKGAIRPVRAVCHGGRLGSLLFEAASITGFCKERAVTLGDARSVIPREHGYPGTLGSGCSRTEGSQPIRYLDATRTP